MSGAKLRGVMTDFVIVDGGLVTNDPDVDVFDLDCLDSDFVTSDQVEEVAELQQRVQVKIAELNDDIRMLHRVNHLCKEWLINHEQQ